MSQFAPVAPVHLLRKMRDQFGPEMLGKYHLVLAHDVSVNQKAWNKVMPIGSTVIIDNSIIELGTPVPAEVMLEATRAFDSSCRRVVVLPDTFDDAGTTFRDSLAYYMVLKEKLPEDVEYMYVVQARDVDEVEEAVQYGEDMLCDGLISWISVPRRICDRMGTRWLALLKVLELKLKYPKLSVHLMGFSNNIQDDIFCARCWGVEGIDSAVPLRLGQKREVLSLTYEGDQAGPRGSFWEDAHQHITTETRMNMQKIRHAISRGSAPTFYVPSLGVSY